MSAPHLHPSTTRLRKLLGAALLMGSLTGCALPPVTPAGTQAGGACGSELNPTDVLMQQKHCTNEIAHLY